MTTFDAPNREVCTVRRDRTNTPLQALVTLNDPVYVEAAQSLARIMLKAGDAPSDRLEAGFQRCLARSPDPAELDRLVQLYQQVRVRYANDPELAKKMATDPIGPAPGYEPGRLGRPDCCRKRSAQSRRNVDEAINSNEQYNESPP